MKFAFKYTDLKPFGAFGFFTHDNTITGCAHHLGGFVLCENVSSKEDKTSFQFAVLPLQVMEGQIFKRDSGNSWTSVCVKRMKIERHLCIYGGFGWERLLVWYNLSGHGETIQFITCYWSVNSFVSLFVFLFTGNNKELPLPKNQFTLRNWTGNMRNSSCRLKRHSEAMMNCTDHLLGSASWGGSGGWGGGLPCVLVREHKERGGRGRFQNLFLWPISVTQNVSPFDLDLLSLHQDVFRCTCWTACLTSVSYSTCILARTYFLTPAPNIHSLVSWCKIERKQWDVLDPSEGRQAASMQ